MDSLARDRDFDPSICAAFQRLLAAWGDAGNLAVKRRVWEALAQGRGPAHLPVPETRAARMAFRIALRQAGRRDGESDLLAAWRAAFDRGPPGADDDAPGH